jgi:murein DD-endopeptidase MepM/ murein hydrolase activator NlpD
MIKRLVFVFGVVFALGFFYYLFTSATNALSSMGTGLSVSPGIIVPAGPTNGLKDVDFSQFGKGGSGWGYITQGYGRTAYSYLYFDHWHNGIDIAANYNAPIHSPVAGTVVAVTDQDNYCPRRAFGRLVVIEDNANHAMLMFAHLNQILVSPGQSVAKGAEIATVGATGEETGIHLHFSVYKADGFSMAPAHGCGPYPQGVDENPVPYLESVAVR